jgi:hypothetical protein
VLVNQVIMDAAEVAVDPRGDLYSEFKAGIIGHGRFSGSSVGLAALPLVGSRALQILLAGLFRPLFADALRVSLDPVVAVAAVLFLVFPTLVAVLLAQGFDLAACHFQAFLVALLQFGPSIRKAVYDFHAQITGADAKRGALGFLTGAACFGQRLQPAAHAAVLAVQPDGHALISLVNDVHPRVVAVGGGFEVAGVVRLGLPLHAGGLPFFLPLMLG